ncbi:MAG: DUF1223 domain-containing protein [Bacteroidota bacterium]
MKNLSTFTYLLLVVLGATFLLIAWIAPSPTPATKYKAELEVANNIPNGIAVVELFTSQGCSSCPPADELLRSISEKAAEKGLAIYPLSFHVDYWNRLGWKDPYSQPAFSQRQRHYARTWQNAQVYTPQMVVNGSKGFVGSRQQEAWKTIEEALSQSATTTVRLGASATDQEIEVSYQLAGEYAGQQLQLALVEQEVETSVRRGENSGKKLHHSHVVREYASIKLDNSGSGKMSLMLPDDMQISEAQLIAYVQHPTSLTISGASSLLLENVIQ